MKKIYKLFFIVFCTLFLYGFTNSETSLEYNNEVNTYSSAVPSKFDTRSNVLVTTFKNASSENQGNLSLCWAFSSNNILEAYLEKTKYKTYNFSENAPDYVSRYFKDSSSFGSSNSTYNILKYWLYGLTPIEESSFGTFFTSDKSISKEKYLYQSNSPISVDDVVLFDSLDTKKLMNAYVTLNNSLSKYYNNAENVVTMINQHNEEIKKHIQDYGSVFGVIYTKFLTRTSTDSDGASGFVYNSGDTDKKSYSNTAHAITIIGWDDNHSGVMVNGHEFKGAWLVANSWGNDTPYLWVSYYDINIVENMMGITSASVKNSSSFNKTYIVGKSSDLMKESSFEDNRVDHFTSTLVDIKNQKFTYNIGTNEETLKSIKMLYTGFSNTTKVVEPKIKIIVSNNGKESYYIKTIKNGLNSFTFSDMKVSGTVDITVNIVSFNSSDAISIGNMYYILSMNTLSNTKYSYAAGINADESKKIIYNIPASTTISNLSNYILNSNVGAYKNGTKLSKNDTIGTGYNITIDDGNLYDYTVSVLGDINGDGKINISDVAKLYQYHMGKISMDDIYIKASDVTKNSKVDISDVAKLYQYHMGKIKGL